MSALETLFSATTDLRQSASNEGCEDGLMIVDANALQALLSAITSLKQESKAMADTSSQPDDKVAALAKLISSGGLCLADCIRAFSVDNGNPYVVAARKASDNDLEIDDNTAIAEGEDGAWVLAWMWVSKAEAGIEDESDSDAGVQTRAEETASSS